MSKKINEEFKLESIRIRKNKYRVEWGRKNRNKQRNYLKNHRKRNLFNPKNIYRIIRVNAYRRNKKIEITEEQFTKWYNNSEKKCYYCNMPEKYASIISKLINSKVCRLTIDRVDNNKGYLITNIVLACDWCNQIKGNILSGAEMKIIGTRIVHYKWKKYVEKK